MCFLLVEIFRSNFKLNTFLSRSSDYCYLNGRTCLYWAYAAERFKIHTSAWKLLLLMMDTFER